MAFQIPKFLKRKRNIWIIAILIIILLVGYFIFGRKGNANSVQVGTVSKQDLQETVLSTGQVVSSTDLNLSFQGSGIVRKVLVSAGDKVKQGQLLASLDQSSALASLTTANGSLKQAQANYDKLTNGATPQDIQMLQDAVTSAKVNVNSSVNNATTVLNSAYTAIYNAYAVVNTLQINYFGSNDQSGIAVQENKANINDNLAKARSSIDQINSTDGMDIAILNMQNYLNSVFNSLQITRDQCDLGTYYTKISIGDKTSLDTQKAAISAALTSVNNLQSSIASYSATLQTAEHNLSAKQLPPRQEDVDLAKAQILSAEGQVASAQTFVNNLIVVAPEAGTITQVDVKVGELATPAKEVLVLQDVGNLHAEADVSEANIAALQIGQDIDYTFDALGPDQHFAGKVVTINPASTVISGVVDYLVKGSLDNIPGIKPGMTANMTILVAKKDSTLAVPSTAVINKNNKQYVRVIDDSKNKSYHEVEVKTGLQADGGLVEIVSGLNDGQQIVTYIKP